MQPNGLLLGVKQTKLGPKRTSPHKGQLSGQQRWRVRWMSAVFEIVAASPNGYTNARTVDRLGRSLQDLVGFLGDLEAAGVHLYLDRQGVDTTTPGGKAQFQMMGVFAEFERAMIQERINAGIARARKHGTKSGRPIGRPRLPDKALAAIHSARAQGKGIKRFARGLGVGVGTVQKAVRAE